MTTQQRHDRTDLLLLFGPWAAGVRLAAGECLLSFEPTPASLLGEWCPQEPCRTLICGTDREQLAAHLADHRRRWHG